MSPRTRRALGLGACLGDQVGPTWPGRTATRHARGRSSRESPAACIHAEHGAEAPFRAQGGAVAADRSRDHRRRPRRTLDARGPRVPARWRRRSSWCGATPAPRRSVDPLGDGPRLGQGRREIRALASHRVLSRRQWRCRLSSAPAADLRRCACGQDPDRDAASLQACSQRHARPRASDARSHGCPNAPTRVDRAAPGSRSPRSSRHRESARAAPRASQGSLAHWARDSDVRAAQRFQGQPDAGK